MWRGDTATPGTQGSHCDLDRVGWRARRRTSKEVWERVFTSESASCLVQCILCHRLRYVPEAQIKGKGERDAHRHASPRSAITQTGCENPPAGPMRCLRSRIVLSNIGGRKPPTTVNFVASWPAILGTLWHHADRTDPLENVRFSEMTLQSDQCSFPVAFFSPKTLS